MPTTTSCSSLQRREALLLLSALPLANVPVIGSAKAAQGGANARRIIGIEYPEVYELANIILALTPHGIEDELQVQKDFPFYATMREYFEPFRSHPIVIAANYSRDLWKEYLSFRTDAYAFQFNDRGELARSSDFRAFDIQAFDDNLFAVQDFAQATRFRDFFAAQEIFRAQVTSGYRSAYLIEEMRAFLAREFDDFFAEKSYVVALSPFVGAQNLHRNITDSLTVDFPSVHSSILNGSPMARSEQASAIHTLFTEMDHGYVNPTSERYGDRLQSDFDDSIWETNSGYAEYPRGVFNEYMTWAIFDIFVEELFPAHAHEVSYNWHLVNQNRGFIYSYDFAQILLALRKANPGTPIKDLYPALLDRLAQVQPALSKPYMADGSELKIAGNMKDNWLEFAFTEAMTQPEVLSVSVWQDGYENRKLEVTAKDMKWNADSTRLSLRLAEFDRDFERVAVVLNDRGSTNLLFSQKGIVLWGRSGRYVSAG
ncbi:MAG: DUF4932 domain-containing protein [Pseudomonadota bacterium]